MNYEELFNALLPLEKKVKDALAQAQKQQKTICKDSEGGDIRTLRKDIQALSDTLSSAVAAAEQLKATAEDFNTAEFNRYLAEHNVLCIDTFTDNSFYSARRDGTDSGRLITAIKLL